MFICREIKIYIAIALIYIISFISFGIINEYDIYFFIMLFLMSVLIIAAGIILINAPYIRIRRLEKKIKEIIELLNGKEPEISNILDINQIYGEGDISKLAFDINELLNILDESMKKQSREKEFLRDMISDISHQLKTPIASLMVFDDILLNDGERMSEIERNEIINQSIMQLERMKWLIQSMLQLARIEACSIVFCKEKIELKGVLESCINMLSVRLNEKNIKVQIDADNATLTGDEEWLKEAFINIIKNSIDYSPDNSSIIIKADTTPIATVISICDNGPGIPEKDRLNVFKKFYRVNSNSVNPNSVGIGLALSKSIVEGCGGMIRVESRYKDECIGVEKSYTKIVITF